MRANGRGTISWEQEAPTDETDVVLTIDGSRLSYASDSIYRPVVATNEFWRVEVGEDEARVFYQDELVGRMLGQGLPFRVAQDNPEDVQLDCSVGLVQLRRGLGPRFEGWDVASVTVPVTVRDAVAAFGVTTAEADENVPHYNVRSAR